MRAILIRNGKVLLVKHTYLKSWFLPDGGLKNNETFEQGIQRELNEEVGISVSDLKIHGIYNNFFEGKNDNIIVFYSENFTNPNKKVKEIESFDFFDLDQLPEDTSPGTRRRISEFLEGNSSYHGIW